MNMDEILTLVQAVSDSKLTSFKLDQGDMHISLKKEKEEAKRWRTWRCSSSSGSKCSTCSHCSFRRSKHRSTCSCTGSSRKP